MKNTSQKNAYAFGYQGESLFNEWMASPVDLEEDFHYDSENLPPEVKQAKTYKDLCQLISEKTQWKFVWAGGLCLFDNGEGIFHCMAWGIEEMLARWHVVK